MRVSLTEMCESRQHQVARYLEKHLRELTGNAAIEVECALAYGMKAIYMIFHELPRCYGFKEIRVTRKNSTVLYTGLRNSFAMCPVEEVELGELCRRVAWEMGIDEDC